MLIFISQRCGIQSHQRHFVLASTASTELTQVVSLDSLPSLLPLIFCSSSTDLLASSCRIWWSVCLLIFCRPFLSSSLYCLHSICVVSGLFIQMLSFQEQFSCPAADGAKEPSSPFSQHATHSHILSYSIYLPDILLKVLPSQDCKRCSQFCSSLKNKYLL